MTRAEIMRRLHDMVNQLADVPEDWFTEGIWPMHKVTIANRETGEPIVRLVVGIEPADRDT